MSTYFEKTNRLFSPSGDVSSPLLLQRLDGHLKNYNSCFDNRAWDPDDKIRHDYLMDCLNNSGNNMPLGQVVPVDILIDTVVKNRLETLEKTLEAYQRLTLTEEQENLLQIYMKESLKASYEYGLSKTVIHEPVSGVELKTIPQLVSVKINPSDTNDSWSKSWPFSVAPVKNTELHPETPRQILNSKPITPRNETSNTPISLIFRENIENLLPLAPHDTNTKDFVNEGSLQSHSPRSVSVSIPRTSNPITPARRSNDRSDRQELPIIPEETSSRKSEAEFENNRIKELSSTSEENENENSQEKCKKLCLCHTKCAAKRSEIRKLARKVNRQLCLEHTCNTDNSDTEEVTDFSDDEDTKHPVESFEPQREPLMEMIIEKDSQIIALNNELAALKLELQEKEKLAMEVVQKLEAIYHQTVSKENLINELHETEVVVQAIKESFPEVPLDSKHLAALEKIDTETAQIEQLHFEVEAMNRFCTCIAKAHMDMNNEYEKLREVNEQLLSELALEKMQIDQLDSEKIEKLVNDDDQYATMDELNTLQSENLHLKSEISQLNTKIDEMSTKLNELEHMQMLLNSNEKYVEQITKLEDQLEEYKNKAKNSEKLALQLEKYQCEYDELCKDYKEMSEQTTQMKMAVVDFDFLKAERDTLKKQLEDYQHVSEELQRLKCSEKLLARVQHENEKLRIQLTTLQVFETRYNKSRLTIQDKEEKINNLEKEVTKSKETVEYLMKETDQIQMRSTEALTGLRNELEQKNKKILFYEEELEKFQADIEELQRYLLYTIDLLDEQKASGDQKKITTTALTEDYGEVCQAVNEIEKELNELKQRTEKTDCLCQTIDECKQKQKLFGEKLNLLSHEFELVYGVVSDNEKLAATVSSLCKTVEELQVKNAELEGKNGIYLDASVNTIDLPKEKCSYCENQQKLIETLMLENTNLITEIKIWQTKLAQLDHKIDKLIEENKELIEEREHLRNNMHFKELFEESREAVMTLTHQLANSKCQNIEIKKSYSILQNELEKLNSLKRHPLCECIDVCTDCNDLKNSEEIDKLNKLQCTCTDACTDCNDLRLMTTSEISTAIEPHEYTDEINQLTIALENQMRELTQSIKFVPPKRQFSNNCVQTDKDGYETVSVESYSTALGGPPIASSCELKQLQNENESLIKRLEICQQTVDCYQRELEKYKELSKLDVVTLKQQYDRDLAHLLSKHDESVSMLQQMHEDAMQEAQQEFERETDSLREQLAELYRKVDKMEMEEITKKNLKAAPVEVINIPSKCDCEGKISLRLVSKIIEMIDDDVKNFQGDKSTLIMGLSEEELLEQIQVLQKKLLLKKEQMQNQMASLKICLEKEQKRILLLREELDGERKRVFDLQSSFERMQKPKGKQALTLQAQENRAKVFDKMSRVAFKNSKTYMKNN